MTGNLLDDLLNSSELHEEAKVSDEENEKLAPLKNEIELIRDLGIQHFVRAVLFRADMFWCAPSSNIPGFHPPDELSVGGGILHTQRVVRIARTLCASQERSQHEFDIVTAAALLHDITKAIEINGQINFDSMHPYTVDHFAAIVMAHEPQNNVEIKEEDCALILRLIRCHMGPWGAIPETYPVSPLDWIVHFADVIATQLHIMVDGEDIKDWRWNEPKPKRRTKTPKEEVPSE